MPYKKITQNSYFITYNTKSNNNKNTKKIVLKLGLQAKRNIATGRRNSKDIIKKLNDIAERIQKRINRGALTPVNLAIYTNELDNLLGSLHNKKEEIKTFLQACIFLAKHDTEAEKKLNYFPIINKTNSIEQLINGGLELDAENLLAGNANNILPIKDVSIAKAMLEKDNINNLITRFFKIVSSKKRKLLELINYISVVSQFDFTKFIINGQYEPQSGSVNALIMMTDIVVWHILRLIHPESTIEDARTLITLCRQGVSTSSILHNISYTRDMIKLLEQLNIGHRPEVSKDLYKEICEFNKPNISNEGKIAIIQNIIKKSGGYLCGFDLRKIDLTSIDLRQVNLRGVNLSGCDLRNVHLGATDANWANTLQESMNFLDGALLDGADLRGANLEGVHLEFASLMHARMDGVNMQRATFTNADMKYADMRGAKMRGANMHGADLEYANLNDSDLVNVNLRLSRLKNASFMNADMKDTNLSGIKMDGVDLRSAKNISLYFSRFIDFNGVVLDKNTQFRLCFMESENLQQSLDLNFNHLNNNTSGSLLTQIDSLNGSKYSGIKLNLMQQIIEYLADKDISSIIEPLKDILLDSNFNYLVNPSIDKFVVDEIFPLLIDKANKGPLIFTEKQCFILLKYVAETELDYVIENNGFFIQLIHQGRSSKHEVIKQLAQEIYGIYLEHKLVGQNYKAWLTVICGDEDIESEDALDTMKDHLFCFNFDANEDCHFLVISNKSLDNILYPRINNELKDWPSDIYYFYNIEMPPMNKTYKNKIFEIFNVFQTGYEFYVNKALFKNLIEILDLGDFKNYFLDALLVPEYKKKFTDVVEQMELFKKIKPYLTNMDSVKEIRLEANHLNAILESFKIIGDKIKGDINSPKVKAILLLTLSGIFTKYSSSRIFGIEGDSPLILRYYAYALMRAAYEIDNQVLTEKHLNEFTNKLLGLEGKFDCTEILSGKILDICKSSRDFIRGIIPPAWI